MRARRIRRRTTTRSSLLNRCRNLRLESLEDRRLLATAEILVTLVDSPFTTEDGVKTAELSVALTGPTPPADVVEVYLTSSDPSEGGVPVAPLTFNDAGGIHPWNEPQTAIVTGVDDDVADGQRPYIVWLYSESVDLDYGDLETHVSLSNVDDDGPGVAIVPFEELVTRENGAPTSFQVFLTSEPTADVTLNL